MQYYSGNNLLSTDSLNTKDLVILISPNNTDNIFSYKKIKPYTKYAKVYDFVKAISGNIDSTDDINKKYKDLYKSTENIKNNVVNLSSLIDIFDYETQKYKPYTISNDINELSIISYNLTQNSKNIMYNVNDVLSALLSVSFFLNNKNDNDIFDTNMLSNKILELYNNYENLSIDLYANISNQNNLKTLHENILSIKNKLSVFDFNTKEQQLSININNISSKIDNFGDDLINKLSSMFIKNNEEL